MAWCWVCGVWWRCDGIRWWMVQPGPGIQHFYSTLTAPRTLETFRFLSRKVWNSVFVVCWLYCDAVKSTLFSNFIFFEEKSGLLWREEMWAQSSWEKVTVFLCRKWHKMKCFVCREVALEIRDSHGDCQDPQVLGTSCYGVLYAMATMARAGAHNRLLCNFLADHF